MTNEEAKEKLSEITVHPKRLKIYLQNHFPELYDAIIDLTSFLDSDATFAERVYCIKNSMTSKKLCESCKSAPVRFYSGTGEYAHYCSTKCSKSATATIEKRLNSIEQRYGSKVGNIEQIKKTREEKYGAWHPADFNEKCKQTLLKEHGSECWNNGEQRKKTCLNKYGADHQMKSAEFKESYLKKFAESHGGARCAFELPNVVAKSKQGIRERAWNGIVNDSYAQPLFSHDEFMSHADLNDVKLKFKCNECGTEFASKWDNGHRASLCPTCFPALHRTSTQEIELYEFVESVDDNAKWKEKVNRELIPNGEIDIVIPKKKVAIEYDGLYWHSEDENSVRGPSYHLNKTKECEEQGYQLIHVFENEWLTKKEIVKSRLRNLLGVYDKTVYARKCVIKEVDSKLSKAFQEQNHIQGAVHASVNLGLYFEDALVSLMTFGKTRFSKKHEWEMLRFCSKLNWHVIGAAGKLLAYFEKIWKPKSLVSYADRRWSQGKVYKALGFTLDHVSPPNYWYFKPQNTSVLFSRVMFQKHRMATRPDLVPNFDASLSEFQNMQNNGYMRIFDCGNLVFVKNYV